MAKLYNDQLNNLGTVTTVWLGELPGFPFETELFDPGVLDLEIEVDLFGAADGGTPPIPNPTTGQLFPPTNGKFC